MENLSLFPPQSGLEPRYAHWLAGYRHLSCKKGENEECYLVHFIPAIWARLMQQMVSCVQKGWCAKFLEGYPMQNFVCYSDFFLCPSSSELREMLADGFVSMALLFYPFDICVEPSQKYPSLLISTPWQLAPQ
jgi:hypothetical protein